jgi:hypothetical protein
MMSMPYSVELERVDWGAKEYGSVCPDDVNATSCSVHLDL